MIDMVEYTVAEVQNGPERCHPLICCHVANPASMDLLGGVLARPLHLTSTDVTVLAEWVVTGL